MSKRIAIIGAGVAGIAAARELKRLQCEAIVLEARDRVGGRAFTEAQTFGMPIDRGCAYLHSAERNPLARYAQDHGFSVIERSIRWRQRVGDREITSEDQQRYYEAFQRYESSIADAARAGRDVSAAEVVPCDKYRAQFDAVMGWLMGVDTEHVSTLDYDRYDNSDVNWPVLEGLGAVVARSALGLDIRLREQVRRIDWSGRSVRIESSGGVVEADAVIITAPTTVLATTPIDFSPALPGVYEDAFVHVPLGIANKVFFEFEPGQLPAGDMYHFVGSDRTARTASYAIRPAGQELLLAYFGGGLARELEVGNALEQFAREELASIFGADLIKHIRRATWTRWASDPFSCGSYSAAEPGYAHLREQLNVPIAGKIFFAGEACSIRDFGTVHGAWFSGEGAARAVAGETASAD
ncbi:MAG TPA: NAD(P)/FAD-dependent oxidoreductase [Steroidobacteraceae bacterium]|nr:NAD(P)/FAD-dependent oxidoreductase [Steroidobacteraceae bacterium]